MLTRKVDPAPAVGSLGRAASLTCALLIAACGSEFTALDPAGATGSGGASTATSGGTDATTSTGVGGESAVATGTAATGGASAVATGTGGAGVGGDAASTSSGGASEICTNGLDDDSDGLVDCADDACEIQGFTCVGPPPEGWIGPVAYLPSGVVPLECPAEWPTTTVANGGVFSAAPTTCGCSCDPPAGELCSDTPVSIHTDGVCLVPGPAVAGPANQCINLQTAVLLASGAKGASPVAMGGACEAQTTKTAPPPMFEHAGLICDGATTGEGCSVDSKERCMPPPPAGFAPKLCVYALTENLACPPGPFTQASTVFSTVQDDRACSTCICSPPVGTQCLGAKTALHKAADCGAKIADVPHNGVCAAVATNSVVSTFYTAATPSGGTCLQGTSTPSGGVAPSGGMTVCCEP